MKEGIIIVEIIKRKVRKVGNSLSVTLPKEILTQMELEEGDVIEFQEKDGDMILKKKSPIITPEFMNLIADIYEEQKEVFEALVER